MKTFTSVSGRNQHKFSARPSFLQRVTSSKDSYNNYDGARRNKVKRTAQLVAGHEQVAPAHPATHCYTTERFAKLTGSGDPEMAQRVPTIRHNLHQNGISTHHWLPSELFNPFKYCVETNKLQLRLALNLLVFQTNTPSTRAHLVCNITGNSYDFASCIKPLLFILLRTFIAIFHNLS